jgi:putative ABC transport system ATP-binding protein
MSTFTVQSPTTRMAARAVDLVKTHGTGTATVRALDGVTIDFEAGSFTAVMGPSGSGKSTLMHCMAGLDHVDGGRVFLGNTDVTALDEKRRTRLRREALGFVFQSFNLVAALTAAENIRLPLDLAGREVDAGWFDELIDLLGLRERLDHTPAELSGGQQQRVAVARALITRPEIVFADEPTGNLDSGSGSQLLGLLRAAVDSYRQTVLMVTHDPVAAAHADRAVFLVDGRIVDEVDSPTVDRVLDAMKRFDTTEKEL